MTKARSMLDKVREMEAVGQHPLLAKIGSLDRLEQVISQPPPNVDAHVGPFLLECVRRWINGTDNDQPIPPEFDV